MKAIFIRVLAILVVASIASSPLHSQTFEEDAGCVVSEVMGKVTYQTKGNSTPRPVAPGAILPSDATVMVGKKASFTLVCDDRSLPVNKKGTFQMSVLEKEVQAKGEESRFAKMVFAAKGYVAPDTTKKAKGWGDKDSIIFNIPLKGKIPLQPVTFRWTSLKEGSNYKLAIFQKSKDLPILMATTSVASFSFNPEQLAVQLGQTYHAQVTMANNVNWASETISFTFVPKKEAEAALSSLMHEREYQKSNLLQKNLIEAAELEAKGLNTLANEYYLKALKTGSNNPLAGQMYSAFLARVK